MKMTMGYPYSAIFRVKE